MEKLEHLGIGDILKAEAIYQSRAVIAAPSGTKAGQLVEYSPRSTATAKYYLVALTDEIGGEVIVQPHNCVINLDVIAETDITEQLVKADAVEKITVDKFKASGDLYGIVYIGTPKK